MREHLVKGVIFVAVLGGVAMSVMAFEREAPVVVPYPTAEHPEVWREHLIPQRSFEVEAGVRGIIAPYDVRLIGQNAALYQSISEDPEVVVLLGSYRGDAVATCSGCEFEVPFGAIRRADDLILALHAHGVSDAPEVFDDVPQIAYHTPFIASYFPEARLLPLVIPENISAERRVAMVRALMEVLPENTLVVAPTHFSRFLPREVADFHDITAKDAVMRLDGAALSGMDMDAPAPLELFFELMEARGAVHAAEWGHFNSQDFNESYLSETESFYLFTFHEEAVKDPYEPVVTMLVSSDVPDAFPLFVRGGWRQNEVPEMPVLEKIRMKDDRFFRGSHFLIFQPFKDGCTITAFHGQQIAMCFFEEGRKHSLRAADEADFVYVEYAFSGKELTAERTKMLRALAKSGADVVIGRNLDLRPQMERYKGTAIFYSLGDFVVENSLFNELSTLREGVMLGLSVTKQGLDISYFPIEVRAGIPQIHPLWGEAEFLKALRED